MAGLIVLSKYFHPLTLLTGEVPVCERCGTSREFMRLIWRDSLDWRERQPDMVVCYLCFPCLNEEESNA